MASSVYLLTEVFWPVKISASQWGGLPTAQAGQGGGRQVGGRRGGGGGQVAGGQGGRVGVQVAREVGRGKSAEHSLSQIPTEKIVRDHVNWKKSAELPIYQLIFP